MIDVKELRIGAHVEFNKERVKILGIEVADDEDVPVIIKTSLASVEPDEIEPIPLTADLLQEIGFVCIEQRGSISVWERGNIHICILGERIAARIENGKNSPSISSIRYLHELEAFVYLTTKQELIKEE